MNNRKIIEHLNVLDTRHRYLRPNFITTYLVTGLWIERKSKKTYHSNSLHSIHEGSKEQGKPRERLLSYHTSVFQGWNSVLEYEIEDDAYSC